VCLRIHINLEQRLVAQLDRRVGRRKRSAFIAETVRRALDEERRWDDIVASLGVIADRGHDWERDPAEWVRAERRGDRRRVG
jgi:metal-responsive CopG/Arc/MetJ family transcriptional regulator